MGEGECQVPHVSESVSTDADGYVNVTLSNLSVSEDMPMEISFQELNPSSVEASILTGAMNAHNTFEDPECVKECRFTEFKAQDGKIVFTIPACSVISLRVK